MNKSVILSAALVGILGVAYYQSNQRNARLHRSTSSVKMRELLFPDFDINGIRKVRVKEDKSEATITVKNDTWVVEERGDYPIDKEKLQTALMSLKYEKIKAGRRIGKDSWGKIGVNSPGDATAYGVGTLVELFGEDGKIMHSFVLGGQVSSSGGKENPMSMFGGPQGNRFIRLRDEDTIWEIADQLSDLTTKPAEWLSKSFVDVQKIKSVEINNLANPAESWKASRPDDKATEFVLENAKPEEKLDNGRATLSTLLASAAFLDVVPKDKVAELAKSLVTKVKITTFDGFIYELQVSKKKVDEADKYYVTVEVSANFPKERAPVKDEKPEDKKKNDEAFAAERKKLEEKLVTEKAFAGWGFETSEYTVSSLLKNRSEVLLAPNKPDEATQVVPPSDGSGVSKLKGAVIMDSSKPNLRSETPAAPAEAPKVEGATPPALTKPASPLPETPKVELKPAPEPAKPAEEPKK